MSWYRTGTVAVTNASTTVTGTGTAFVANISSGEAFLGPDGKTYEVASITSDTALVLATPYAGATASGQTYQIGPYRGRINELNAQVSALLTRYANVADNFEAGSFGDGSVAAPSMNFASDPDTGLYRYASNVLGFAAGGANIATLDSAKLTINGQKIEIISTTDSNGFLRLQNTVGRWSVGMLGTSGWERFSIYNDVNNAEYLTVLENGNVGINNNAPAVKFTVNSSGEIARFLTNTARGSGTGYIGIYDPTGVKGLFGYSGAVDDNLSITNVLNADMLFRTNNTERIRITSAGNVGIGVSAPATKFHVVAAAVAATGNADVARFAQAGDGGVNVIFSNSVANLGLITAGVTGAGAGTDDGYMAFATTVNGTLNERMRITSAGSIGIGATNPDVFGRGYARVLGVSSTASGAIAINSATGNVTYFDMGVNGALAFGISVTATYSQLAVAGNFPMLFTTNSNERARIDGSGTMFVGDATSIIGSGRLRVQMHNDGFNTAFSTWHSGDYTGVQFVRGGAQIGTITVSASAVAYNTTSDYRSKIVHENLVEPGAIIDAIEVYSGHFIADETETEQHLFIAHEVQEHVPYAVTGIKDAVDDDDNPIMQQMDPSKLIPIMWAEIRSLRARLAVLEAE